MRNSTIAALFAAMLLAAGCGGPKSQVLPEEAVNFRAYRHVGIPPFVDKKGKGAEIAAAFDAEMGGGLYEPMDQKAFAQVLAKYKPDRDLGYGIEALEFIRQQTGADSLILGRAMPDWSAVSITMVELDTGATILHAILRPRGRGKKAFAAPEEIAKEFSRVYRTLR